MSYKAGVCSGDSIYYANQADLEDAVRVFTSAAGVVKREVGFVIPDHSRIHELVIQNLKIEGFRRVEDLGLAESQDLTKIAEAAEQRFKEKW